MELVSAAVVLVAVLIGIGVGTVLQRRSRETLIDAAIARSAAELQARLAAANAELQHVSSMAEARAGELREVRSELAQVRQEKEMARTEGAAQSGALREEIVELRSKLSSERLASVEKLRLLDEARVTLADQFKLVAGDIMQTNAAHFAQQSQHNMGTILDPLKTRLQEFQQKVEEVYVNEGKDRAALKDQVQRLVDLNNQLSKDANNLTSALRGSNKSQGNWGELILQRILEDAGLRPGAEFIVQDAQTNDEGRRQQPDVVIQLPEGRKIVIDAKVSLRAFERAVSADAEDDRKSATRDHLISLRAHMKGLSDREYGKLYGSTLDFVIMFVPIEPAFMLAIAEDEKLCADAWARNVLLVSPSTLLFVLRTVAYLWRQEAQSRNAKEIASRGAQLYDKLVGFVADLESVGARLDAAQQSYHDAHRKLSSGKGSVIRQADLLRELGVKPTKRLSSVARDAVDDEQHALPAGSDDTR